VYIDMTTDANHSSTPNLRIAQLDSGYQTKINTPW